jgi:hypothetical protein
MSTKARAAVIVALSILCMTPAALAAPAAGGSAQAQAEARIQKGIDLRRKMRDAEALVEFQEAMKLFPSPRAKGQIGLAQLAVGLFEVAEVTLSDVLANSGDDAWVNAHRDALADALTKVKDHLGTLNVSGEPRGAAVEINGSPSCSLPCSVHVQAGDVIVKVQAPEFLPLTRTVSVGARQIASQVFTLVRAHKDPVATKVDPAVETRPRAEKPMDSPPAERPGDDTPSPGAARSSPWPWIAAGGSVVALAFGAVEAARWFSKAEEFNNMKDSMGIRLCGADGSGGTDCSRVLSEGHTARALSIGGFVVGAALGVTAILLFTHQSDDTAAVACAPSPFMGPSAVATPGMACSARF